MTVSAVSVTQRSNRVTDVTWSDPADPVAGFTITRQIGAETPVTVATVRGAVRSFADVVVTGDGVVTGDVLTYTVNNGDDASSAWGNVTIRDLESAFTFGPVDPLLSEPTYTDIDTMKRRLGIDAADTAKDPDLTAAALSAQIQINQRMGRSLPDTGTNPQIPGIPQPIRDFALAAGIRIYKRADAPFGSAGGDVLLGVVTISDEIDRAFRDDPLLLGYVVSRGVA